MVCKYIKKEEMGQCMSGSSKPQKYIDNSPQKTEVSELPMDNSPRQGCTVYTLPTVKEAKPQPPSPSKTQPEGEGEDETGLGTTVTRLLERDKLMAQIFWSVRMQLR